MTGHENFQSNDAVSNNNVVESTSKCLFADAYSGIKCGGSPSTNENVTQRMGESTGSDTPLRNQTHGGTHAVEDNSNHRTQSGGWIEPGKPQWLDKEKNTPKGGWEGPGGKGSFDKMPYDPNMPKNEKLPNGKFGDKIEKLPNGTPIGKLPNGEKGKFPMDGLEKRPDGKLPNKMEEKLDKYPNKVEEKLDKYPDKMEGQLDKSGKDGQFGDKINRKGEGGGGGFKDGEDCGGGGSFGKDFEKHGSGKSSLGPLDKNGDGTIDGTEKQFDKNGNDILDSHEGMHNLANEAKRAAQAGSEASGEAFKSLNKGIENLKKDHEVLNKKIYPELNDSRGASGTLPSIREIAPDINAWSRTERAPSVDRGAASGSAGRRGYNDAVPAEQTRRQYRDY